MIHAVKHIFPAHVVVQFNCTNTIKEQCLENVTVLMDLADAVRGQAAAAFWCLVCVLWAAGGLVCCMLEPNLLDGPLLTGRSQLSISTCTLHLCAVNSCPCLQEEFEAESVLPLSMMPLNEVGVLCCAALR